MNHFDDEDTQIRLEALRLASQDAVETGFDPVDLAERYRKFLTGEEPAGAPYTINEHGERVEGDKPADDGAAKPNESRPYVFTAYTNSDKLDEALAAATRARANFKPNKDKAAVYAEVMAIVHEAGVFVDPVLLARDLGRIIIDAEVRPA